MHVKREAHRLGTKGTLTSSEGRHQQQTLEYSHVLVMRPTHAGDRESPTCQREKDNWGSSQCQEISTTAAELV